MKQQSKKYLLLILLIAVLVAPSFALAAWWNPLSWGVWNKIFRQTQESFTPGKCNKNKPIGLSLTNYIEKAEWKNKNISIDVNFAENCCASVGGKSSVKDSNIILEATTNGNTACNCVCGYDVHFDLKNLPVKDYKIVLPKYDGTEGDSLTLKTDNSVSDNICGNNGDADCYNRLFFSHPSSQKEIVETSSIAFIYPAEAQIYRQKNSDKYTQFENLIINSKDITEVFAFKNLNSKEKPKLVFVNGNLLLQTHDSSGPLSKGTNFDDAVDNYIKKGAQASSTLGQNSPEAKSLSEKFGIIITHIYPNHGGFDFTHNGKQMKYNLGDLSYSDLPNTYIYFAPFNSWDNATPKIITKNDFTNMLSLAEKAINIIKNKKEIDLGSTLTIQFDSTLKKAAVKANRYANPSEIRYFLFHNKQVKNPDSSTAEAKYEINIQKGLIYPI